MIDDWRKRLVLALALAVATGGVLERTQEVPALPFPRGLARLIDLAPMTTAPARALVALAVLGLLALFVSGRWMQPAGWALAGLALVAQTVVHSIHTDDVQGSQEPYSTLIAWLLGVAIAPRLGRDREALGSALACGVVAAGYTMGAISKLLASGPAWIDGRAMQLLVYERAFGAPEPLASLRLAFAESPALCTAAMAGALVLELSGALFLFRRARWPFALGAVALHVSAGVLFGYLHPDWALTAIAWAYAAGGRPTEAAAT